eukprot:8093741-Ditylum_brightwellii.AAC.1
MSEPLNCFLDFDLRVCHDTPWHIFKYAIKLWKAFFQNLMSIIDLKKSSAQLHLSMGVLPLKCDNLLSQSEVSALVSSKFTALEC